MIYHEGKRLPTVTDDAIRGFFGEYRWLSNFHLSYLTVDGLTFPSAEHAYQAMKVPLADRQIFVECSTPGKAKRLGSSVELPSDWNARRVAAMTKVLRAKFGQSSELRALLLATGTRYLEETNDWKDCFWGVDPKFGGANKLGELLMILRSQLRTSLF